MKTNRKFKSVILLSTFFYITLTYVKAQIYIQDPTALTTLINVNSVIDLIDVDDTIVVNYDPEEHFYMGITFAEIDKSIEGAVIKSYANKKDYKRGKYYKKNSYSKTADEHNKLKNATNYSLLTCGFQEMVIQITIIEREDLPPRRKLITLINERVIVNTQSKKEKRTKAVKSIIELAGIVSALL